MKNSELRFGNLILHNNIPIIIVGISIDGIEYKFENDNQIYVRNFVDVLLQPIPISEKLFEILGIKKYNTMMPSYEIIIEANGFYKSLSLSYNNDNSTHQYYCWFREGDMDKERHRDSIVCLRKDLKYLHEFQNLYFALTGKELINLDKVNISEILKKLK